MENEVFIPDSETLIKAIRKAGLEYGREYGYDNRYADFNLYLQDEIGRFIKEVDTDEISQAGGSE